MKSDNATKLRELTGALEAAQANAAARFAEFEQVRSDALSLGADLLTNEAAFAKLDEAGKVYDAACDAVNDLQAKLNRIAELTNEGAPSAPRATLGNDGERDLVSEIGERWAASETLAYLKRIGAQNPGTQIGTTPSFAALPKEAFAALMTTGTYPSTAWRKPGIVALPQKSLGILDLISVVPTDSETVEWVYEKTFTNTAAETAEGDAAPEGTLDFDTDSTACKWIPFSIPSTRQLLSDEARMRPWIEERLPRGVRTRLQAQILAGNGQTVNLKGITNWSGVLVQDMGALSPADVLHKAKTKIIVQTYGNYQPNVVLLHPNDEERLVLHKDDFGRYRWGGPQGDGVSTVWGMIPVVHPEVTEGSPIVADITQCELYVREGVTISVTDSHADFFTKGKLMWLCSGRFGFAVLQPKAFCQVTNFDS